MKNIQRIDQKLLAWFRHNDLRFARLSIAVVYIWFGTLKLLGMSPAATLVMSLQQTMIPFVPFDVFYTAFGVFEAVLGLAILKRGWERVILPFLLLHLITTAMPLAFLPTLAWRGFLVPTLEGQYIIKNVLIVALMIDIASRLRPIQK